MTLPLDGKPAGDFVTATATDAESNTSEFSHCAAVEIAPLVLTLGVLRNPFLGQFLDIYMVASTELDTQSVALTVGGEDVPMALADSAVNLWKGDYEITGSATLPIEVCATSPADSSDCASTSVAALFAKRGEPVDLWSGDHRFRFLLSAGDVAKDGIIVIIPSTDPRSLPPSPKEKFPAPVVSDSAAGDSPAAYTVGASNLAEQSAITVEFRYSDFALPPGTELSQLYIQHVGVGRRPSVVDPIDEVVRATVEKPGRFELRIGSTGAGRTADARFLRLDPNYPNPFNPSTMIQYELQTSQHVRLTVYDALGRRAAQLIDEIVPAGVHRLPWNATTGSGRALASGVYFLRLETSHGEATRKVVLVR